MKAPTNITYNISEVKFQILGDKKGPMKGFLSWSLENWLSIFASSLSTLFLYLWKYVHVIYVCHKWWRELKRDWNMILNSHYQSFSKTEMFLWAC